jgi:hypothetical protein
MKQKRIIKIAFSTLVILFIFLNQFQWWQVKHEIIDLYRTTKAYYWAVFLKTSVPPEAEKLKLVYRDFSGKMELTNPDAYQKYIVVDEQFENPGQDGIMTEDDNSFYRFKEGQEFYEFFQSKYKEITQQNHFWAKASFDVRYPDNFEGTLPCFVMTMERKEGSYRYFAPEIKIDSGYNHWTRVEYEYLSPEIRNSRDRFKCYIWKRGKSVFDIDNVRIELYQKK